MKKLAGILVVVVLLGVGCTYYKVKGEREAMRANLYDQYFAPLPGNYFEMEKQMVSAVLIDPYSAMWEDGAVSKDVLPYKDPYARVQDWKPVPVSVHCLGVNAKNRMGGYVGMNAYMFAWYDGRLIATCGPVTRLEVCSCENFALWSYTGR